MNLTASQRKHGYNDFFVAVADMRKAVAELKRLLRREKAETLLSERRVRIFTCDEDSLTATIRGDEGDYLVSYFTDRTLLVKECSCPFGQQHPVKGGCSHTKAIDRVWQPSKAASGQGVDR